MPMCVHTAPHYPCPPHLPWLMLILFTRSALRAVLVSVSITWSLCSTTSPWEAQARGEGQALPRAREPSPTLPPSPQWVPSVYCPHAVHAAQRGCRSGC